MLKWLRFKVWIVHELDCITNLGLLFQRMYWILGRKSELSLASKLLLYKSILKPIWTYGIPLWGTASHWNIKILQRFQNKALRTMVNAPWYGTVRYGTYQTNSYTPICRCLPSGKKSRNLVQTIELNCSRIRITSRPAYFLNKTFETIQTTRFYFQVFMISL